MAMFAERIVEETPELHEQRRADAVLGRREGVDQALRRADGLGRGPDHRQRQDHPLRRVQLRRPGGDRRRRERFQGGDEADFRELLYAPEMHDPDLIIRTSGEQRLSNYLMWQSAYSELVFTRGAVARLRPRRDFEAAMVEFSARRRRFGGR